MTYHSAADNVVGWSNDGKKVVFSSTRGDGVFPSVATLWQVAVDGGIETPISTDWGASASYSPDGSKLAFSRHPGVWSRKHYRGSYAVDLWVMDIAAHKFTKLGDAEYKGNKFWPMYGSNGEIYFVADTSPMRRRSNSAARKSCRASTTSGRSPTSRRQASPGNHHADGNLYLPRISADRKTIVYEENFGIWKLDIASGKSSEIRIDIKSDSRRTRRTS